jgi:hypothetical protein
MHILGIFFFACGKAIAATSGAHVHRLFPNFGCAAFRGKAARDAPAPVTSPEILEPLE